MALSSPLVLPWNSLHWCSNFIICEASAEEFLRKRRTSIPKSSKHPQAKPIPVSATGISFTKAIRSSRHRVFAKSFTIAGIHSKGASHHGSNKLFNCVTHLTATFYAFWEEISLQWATLIRCIFRAILFGQKAIDTFKTAHTEAHPNAN